MQLSIDNLEEIHKFLMDLRRFAHVALDEMDLKGNVALTSQNKQLLDTLFDKLSGQLLEVSHIDSFLQQCDISVIGSLTPEQNAWLIDSQKICQSIKESIRKKIKEVVAIKEKIQELCSQPTSTEYSEKKHEGVQKYPESDKSGASISSKMLCEYDECRRMLKEIHGDLLFMDAKNMIETAGRRLGVKNGRHLHIETEHEMNILVDYGLFQYFKNGRNVVERYHDARASYYDDKMRSVLTAFKNTRFSFLKIVEPIDDSGLIVHDALIGKDLIMIDRGLSQAARKNESYSILTHYLVLPEFIMTTGASTPVVLDSEAGKQMQGIFEALVLEDADKSTSGQKKSRQLITELYKTVIHSDLAQAVHSRELPLNYHQMYKSDVFVN